MRADVPADPGLLTGTRLRRFDQMAIDALGRSTDMQRGAGFGHLMIGIDDSGVAAQTQVVIAGAADLMTVSARCMYVMTGGAGLETAAVAVLARGNKIGVLLMVRF